MFGVVPKTKFTSYSMTSSIMRRSEKLVSLDDRFEEMFLDKGRGNETIFGPLILFWFKIYS